MVKPRAAEGVDLGWVDGSAPPQIPFGTSFGVPWAQGEVDKTTSIAISTGGTSVPLQTWPLAYWPDGSLKWTGHALSAEGTLGDSLQLTTDTPAEPSNPVSVDQTDSLISVSTGSFTANFNTSGSPLIKSLTLDGAVKAESGSLILYLQDAPDEPEVLGDKPSVSSMTGTISSVTVEQEGPVRAVIKVQGKYSGSSHADFLPFIVRFYVSAGATSVRMVHFFIFDGDQTKDFIKGLGLTFDVPLTDELQDRHVRFVSSEGGVWGEAVRVVSGLRRDATAAVLTPQFEGTPTPDLSTWPTTVSSEIDQLPVWADYTLDQLTPGQFTIKKRSTGGRDSSFINHAGIGDKAAGVGYIGGATNGGTVFGLRDFWEAYPRGLDVRGAGGDSATVTLWAYSPRALAMDMRHYDTVAHGLDLTYEDVGNPDPDPTGIGRSYELVLSVVGATPSRSDISDFATVVSAPPQVVASPEFYASHELFGGRWNVPNPTSSQAQDIETRKSWLLDFYVAEVKQREFYGFWNYGDIMHTYDQTRHTWRYDVGGFAWDNGELASDLWLWMSFLRTGRADVFHMAYAMTRHLSEVDFHHTGTFAGLGSRHNVSHWGDGAKEARIATSSVKRPFYYLTADELIGDIMDFSLQADESIVTWEPLRKILPPPSTAPGRVRIGPDWTTLCGNWFVKWERTNDSQWLDRMKTGMHDLGAMKFGLFTGYAASVGWDPATGHLTDENNGTGTSSYHLTMVFGGSDMLMEVMEIIDDEPDFDAAWVDFCRYYNASDADKIARYGMTWNSGGFNYWYAKLEAYAGQRLNNDALKTSAWTHYLNKPVGIWSPVTQISGTDVLNPINEIPNVATNDASQLSLTEYALLAIAPDFAPVTLDDVREDKETESNQWDVSTLASAEKELDEGKKTGQSKQTPKVSRKKTWKKLLCIGN